MQTKIIGRDVYIDGEKLPPVPSKSDSARVTVLGEKVYINGFAYKNGRWKRTLAAIWHYLF